MPQLVDVSLSLTFPHVFFAACDDLSSVIAVEDEVPKPVLKVYSLSHTGPGLPGQAEGGLGAGDEEDHC